MEPELPASGCPSVPKQRPGHLLSVGDHERKAAKDCCLQWAGNSWHVGTATAPCWCSGRFHCGHLKAHYSCLRHGKGALTAAACDSREAVEGWVNVVLTWPFEPILSTTMSPRHNCIFMMMSCVYEGEKEPVSKKLVNGFVDWSSLSSRHNESERWSIYCFCLM